MAALLVYLVGIDCELPEARPPDGYTSDHYQPHIDADDGTDIPESLDQDADARYSIRLSHQA